jgi:hypothetical protein
MVVPQQVWDSFFGADRLQVDVREKGDSTLGLTTQEKTDANNEVSSVLNTAIPVSPVASSVFERVAAIDDKLPAGTISDLTSGVVEDRCSVALATINLDLLIKSSGVTPTSNSFLDQIMNKSGAQSFSPASDSLEAIRDTAPLGTAMRGTDNAALATGVKLSASGTAQVNAEVVDGLQTDTITEPTDFTTDKSIFGMAWHIYHAVCTAMTIDKSASPETLDHYQIDGTTSVKQWSLTDNASFAKRA